uniref:XLR/SYCP3/FAM9 domain-containing protein n=1 Tax=Ornithorhynchus anatinus TaxID=9258 RepID=A0A6I8N401_ORNAN
MTTNGENLPVSSDDTVMEEQDAGAFQQEENKDLSGFQEDAEEGQTSVADETETKNPGDIPSEMDEDYLGAEIQSLLDGFEGDTSKILPEVMKRLEQYIKSSLQVSTQNIGQHEQEKRDENKENSSQEFLNAFQYEDETVQIFEELYKSVTELLYQQSVSQQSGVNQDMLDAFKQKYDQFIKAIKKKKEKVILTNIQNEMEKMLTLQGKLLLDRQQQQEMATFQKFLQSMLF